ncbi:MAG: pyridoxal-phosphate dependent enzyme [Planctomycetes bacterium]|nr:pyridoxal-phosphate dependent enzyme [Planctomycetota bacterium]
MGVLFRIGRTPLQTVDGVHAQLECANPGGSIKDRVARFLVEEAIQRGELVHGDTIVEATTGNAGIAYALVGRELGFRVRIYLAEPARPETSRAARTDAAAIEPSTLERAAMIRSLDADVVVVPRAGGLAEARRRRDAHRGAPGTWIPAASRADVERCHAQTTGRELVDALVAARVTRLAAFVAGVGSGATLRGVGAALRARWPQVELVAVLPFEAEARAGSASVEHGILGLEGVPERARAAAGAVDAIERVTTAEAHAEAERLHARGYCVGRSAGANHLAARRRAARGGVVATVWPEGGERYASSGLGEGHTGRAHCPRRTECRTRCALLLPA